MLLENYPHCKELIIPPGTQDYRVKIRLYDTAQRLLELWVQIKAGLGGSLRVSPSLITSLRPSSGHAQCAHKVTGDLADFVHSQLVSVLSCCSQLSVSAAYWLVNKSGLPLVFKQEGAKAEASGQFEEHELARAVTPLLFSYADKESNFM